MLIVSESNKVPKSFKLEHNSKKPRQGNRVLERGIKKLTLISRYSSGNNEIENFASTLQEIRAIIAGDFNARSP